MRAYLGTWLMAALWGTTSCAKPNSVELGELCQEQVECKAPANTCLTVGDKSRCSMICTKEERCPDEFVCARMDVAQQQNGKTTSSGRAGYCLPAAVLPSNVAKL